MKHTKGNWIADIAGYWQDVNGLSCCSILDDPLDDTCIIGYVSMSGNDAPTDRKECLANAKLIASAPELLDALKKLRNCFSKDGERTGQFYSLCDQAIKKAES